MSWSHYRTLLSISNVNKINYYIIVFQKRPTVSDVFSFYQIHQAVPGELTWSHYIELLPLKDKNKIKYYIDITIKNNLSTRQLRERIKNK